MILLCRMSLTDPFNGYGLEFLVSPQSFVRFDAGVKTILKEIVFDIVDNDVVKFEVLGSTLRAFKNGVLVDTVVDITYASGVLGFYCEAGGANQYHDNAVGYAEIPALGWCLPLFGVG